MFFIDETPLLRLCQWALPEALVTVTKVSLQWSTMHNVSSRQSIDLN